METDLVANWSQSSVFAGELDDALADAMHDRVRHGDSQVDERFDVTLWLLAGPPGAGRSTFHCHRAVRRQLGNPVVVDPEDRLYARFPEALHAAPAAEVRDWRRTHLSTAVHESEVIAKDYLRSGVPVLFETDLSSGAILQLVNWVRLKQGFVGILFVSVDSPRRAYERIAATAGPGSCLPGRTEVRLHFDSCHERLPQVLSLAHTAFIYDNSQPPGERPLHVATVRNGDLSHWSHPRGIAPELSGCLHAFATRRAITSEDEIAGGAA